MSEFKDAVFVVTGGGGFFGYTACSIFLQLGCKVAALDVSCEALDRLNDIGANDDNLMKIMVDVTDEDSVVGAIDDIVKKFRRIDYLWNNAGYQGQVREQGGSERAMSGANSEKG